MAIGMTYDQYWRDDPTIAIYYRKTYKIKQEEKEWNIWKGGVYTYEALCKVSPVLHAFSKPHTKPLPFSEEPYGIKQLREKELQEKEKKQQEENERLKAQIFFDNWFKATEKHFKK